MIKKGDKVVCINDSSWGDAFLNNIDRKSYDPKKDVIYTVLGTREFDGMLFLYLKEISVIGSDGDRECYEASSFRKLADQNFTNDITAELSNITIIKEGIERIIVKPKKEKA